MIRSPYLSLSYRVDRRVVPTILLLGGLTLLAMVLSVGYGEYGVSPLDVGRTLVGLDTGNADHSLIVRILRLPRVLVAFGVGVALALSGTILQGLTRNPLAAPDVIGINSGAGLVAVGAIVALGNVPLFLLPFGAFGGALLAALTIYGLAWGGGISPLRLILVGVGLTAIASALTTLLMTLGDISRVSQALIWLTGSVYGRSWEHFWPLVPWLLILVPVSLVMARDLNTLALEDGVARGLGSQVEVKRSVLLLVSAALAGAAVATAGTVGFVGLMAPHLARQFVGPTHEGLLPTAALTGGAMVVVADLIGRSLFAPTELPCGVITAIVGAPYFLYVLSRSWNG